MTMTFRYALSVLEDQFDATYRGSKTVREMCTSLTDAISWEGESPDAVYHQFETKSGPNRIVKDDQVIKLANSYQAPYITFTTVRNDYKLRHTKHTLTHTNTCPAI